MERTDLLPELVRRRPVTPEVADALADELSLRRGDVHEVASFYSYLRLPPDAAHVCGGPLCSALRGRGGDAPCLGRCEHLGENGPHVANDGPSIGLLSPDWPRPVPRVSTGTVLAELRASGLTGFGGAGFPVWRKWQSVLAHPGPRAVVVNADEGEPGTFKDRYVLELRPHLLLEGIEIAMRALEAAHAWIYVRDEYGVAIERLEAAVARRGLPVTVVRGAGAYVCGEETALLESLEGRRGEPRLKPPFPAERGYLGMPTLVQNVETLAHVPGIVRRGGERWPRTRLWSISGCVARPGCYEARVDSTLRELLVLAGGATEEIGAIVPGGAAAGILPPSALDELGRGSGGVQFYPASYPVQRLLQDTLRFFAEESCSKCAPCRLGTRTLLRWQTVPRGRLEAVLDVMEQLSVCGLGQSAPTPLRTYLEHWS